MKPGIMILKPKRRAISIQLIKRTATTHSRSVMGTELLGRFGFRSSELYSRPRCREEQPLQ